MKCFFTKFWVACALTLCVQVSFAQFRIDVAGVGLTQLPVTVAPFRGQEALSQRISDIVLADLERSGQFRSILASSASMDENTKPEFSTLRQAGSDAFVAGSVTKLADGRFDVRFRLWDVVKGQDQGGENFPASATDLRMAAHRIADYIYEKLTGDKGIFSTRIAYVTKASQRYQLWVADADGENAQPALASPEPIISPAWSPDGNQLAYVSFESRKPVIYIHNVSTGKRRLIANFKGSNSAPAWSPDGKTLAVTLSRDGGSQLFLLSASGGEPKRLIQSGSIDTEPVFSPDGQSIFFVSDRGGSPQIYKVPATGGGVERVTFTGSYNISPAISSDGRWMAYISRVGGVFKLHVMQLAGGVVAAITETAADESPSFSPNGKLLVYATQQQGREALMTSTLDGKVKARLNGPSGDIREPHWGPFLKP
ncbi:protein TolB [Rhodoferax lithotrophicus]|uniref:Tol-Pal system protein TolB n=1 Tax=Rhodoferax lithotrophicus TaxID=2798804 RepID=A0ABN6D851_9BURK|nr:Tol-Pal system beta propeller repeat protein TolB [Rhodoferax sp. MIZ03]BCO28190.1 protein TolB [Rhodoferax sp. MIZ03]